MTVSFEHPQFLFIGLLAILILYVWFRFKNKHFVFNVPLGPPGGAVFRSPVPAQLLLRFTRLLEGLAFLLFLLALAGPAYVQYRTVWLDRGADVFFVIDCSPSMSALDMEGQSRFAVAKKLVARFARLRPSDAIALVAIGADAALIMPPTVDRKVFNERLALLSIAELGDGTAIGTGLAIAAVHLRNSRAQRKLVVLLTDGENNAGAVHPLTGASLIRESGAELWVVGIGSAGEVPLDYVDPQTGQRKTGVFESRYDPEALRSIALAGGGTFAVAASTGALEETFNRMSGADMAPGRSRTYRLTQSLTGTLLYLVIGFIGLARLIRWFVMGALV
ncbi:MAG: VWA domain-containing protein [Treponema sp.]|nr:VWA domain-containing protein [Treponema sp.]